MTENFKILAEFVKDISSETADIQTYIFVKEQISKYHLNIDINSNNINQYYKKVIKASEAELKLHKEYLKNNLKKNFFN